MADRIPMVSENSPLRKIIHVPVKVECLSDCEADEACLGSEGSIMENAEVESTVPQEVAEGAALSCVGERIALKNIEDETGKVISDPSHEKERSSVKTRMQKNETIASVLSEEASSAPCSQTVVCAEKQKSSEKYDTQPIKRTRSRTEFVPKYDPIQTRKRARTSQDLVDFVESNVSGSRNQGKEETVKKYRTRRTKDEVYMPDIGPRPKAVPKSLLILGPEFQSRSLKKKQPPQTPIIHTSALVQKSMPFSLPVTSQSRNESKAETVRPCLQTPVKLSSVPLDEGGNQSTSEVTQNEDETASYILATEVVGDDCPGSFITVSDGHVGSMQTVSGIDEEQAVAYTMISEEISNPAIEKGNTPTSLLMLAEAAYPSTAETQTVPSLTVSATQSPVKTVLPSREAVTGLHQNEAKAVQAKTIPTYMTVSCQRGSSTVLASSSVPHVQTLDINISTNDSSDPITRTVCGKLVNKADHEQHLAQHLDGDDGSAFMCDVCGEQLKDEEDLELHMAVEHDEEDGENEDFNFNEDEDDNDAGEKDGSQNEHALTTGPRIGLKPVPGTPVHCCQHCGQTFAFAAYLRRHMKGAHSQKETEAVFTCTLCPLRFTSKEDLENHSDKHQMPGGIVLINTKTASRGSGRRRGQGRRWSANHICSICNKTFTSEVYLKAHVLTHGTEKGTGDSVNNSKNASGLQCLYCNEKFRHKGSLKEHLLASHPTAFPYKCTVCQRGFSRDSARVAHERTHQTEKLHFCSQCGEGFTLLTYLNRHMKYRHLKYPKLPCRICHKEFVRHADLVKHTRVHTGEKPYKCEQCGQGFGQQSNYRYHMMRHRGEKPHICTVCNKGFRVPSHLKMHMRQHLNERFNCPCCDKVFSQSRYLHRHMRTHSNAKVDKGTGQLLPASSVAGKSSDTETVMVYDSRPIRMEQIVMDSVTDVSEHVVVEESTVDNENVVQFIMNKDMGDTDGLAVVSEDKLAVTKPSTTNPSETIGEPGVDSSVNEEVMEEQAYVNADEGTSVVVGAFSDGEGGSVEDGNVTLPFKDLTQLLGGKIYTCDVCSESFSIRPNSIYNMIHTRQSHILVINLNDHHHHHVETNS